MFVPNNLLIVLISHVGISLNINVDDCDFVFNYVYHQCVGIAVMVDKTNVNLEINKDLTSVLGLHQGFQLSPVSMVSSSIVVNELAVQY